MRHPTWKLAGWFSWLGIGLAGCLHGQDWRAAVTKPMTRSVADRRESRALPKVVGPFRRDQSAFAKTALSNNPPTSIAQSVEPSKGELAAPMKSPVPTTPIPDHGEQPGETPTMQAGFNSSENIPIQPPPVVSRPVAEELQAPVPSDASLIQMAAQPPANASFAEFERTIPITKNPTPAQFTPNAATEIVPPEAKPVAQAAPLPVITPAAASMPAKPSETQQSRSPTAAPDESPTDNKPQQLFSKSVGRVKELPEVTDSKPRSPVESSAAGAEPPIRPQDVSAVVEQVFEDLRQRRMKDARQRTEWLKQLVSKRASLNSSNDLRAKTEAGATQQVSQEPRRLNVDPNAAVAPKVEAEAFFDDEQPMSRE